MSNETSLPLEGVAIIGMAGRFPGSEDLSRFWRNLCAGVESISFFTDEELIAAGISPSNVAQPSYVKAAPVLDDIDKFDAAFFGINPREAAVMDPQQRLFLECAWAALEDAGYDSESCSGRIGLYAGVRLDSYLLANLWPNLAALSGLDPLQILIGNDKDYLATQVSYRLNLRGPSIGVQTACSTSLVAVALACQSLLLYQCDMALAGAVAVRVPQVEGYFHTAGGIVSADGHCRTFDTAAGGTIFGSGLGTVVLKRLEDAHADGDNIYAVIKGAAVNNDGALKVGYTAPGLSGQAEVIAMAQAAAEVEPSSITYIEAHGTATALGDPVEVAALEEVFRAGTAEREFCAIGSVKTNFGHLDTAAGIAGLIKTTLALAHRQIPPSLHLTQPNPRIDFANSPFFINTRLRDWDTDRLPRRAGVSSFGIGGTNAHVVLEEAPAPRPTDVGCPWQLLPLSARTDAALTTMGQRLTQHLESHPQLDLPDVAFTLQEGRRRFEHRQVLVADSLTGAIAALETGDPRQLFTAVESRRDRPVAFLFPGQGTQYLGMGAGLFRDLPVFRREVERCAELLQPHLGLDLCSMLLSGVGGHDEARELFAETELAQPALFAVEYALAKVWMSWGLRPVAMAGHSLGEYVAACLAGTFSLPDALTLVAARGRLMQTMPEGAMLAVPLPAAELAGCLTPGTTIAAINGPELVVVAGPPAAVAELQVSLEASGVRCRLLHTSRAFHSSAVEPLMTPFTALVSRLSLAPPRIPFLSNVTGEWITAAEATDPAYWARHLRQPVQFGNNLAALLQRPELLLIEVGPGRALSSLAKRHPSYSAEHVILPSLPPAGEPQPEMPFLLNTLGKSWLGGGTVDWRGFRGEERRNRVPLPGYPFARDRHWVETPAPGSATAAIPPPSLSLSECFQLPILKQSMAPRPTPGLGRTPRRWLFLADRGGLTKALLERFDRMGDAVVSVEPGREFSSTGPARYTVKPGRREDYVALLRALGESGGLPTDIVHASAVDPVPAGSVGAELLFLDLLFLAQAIGATPWGSAALRIHVVASGLLSVGMGETLSPEKATLLGPARVIPQEYPRVSCRVLDVLLPESCAERQIAFDLLEAELSAPGVEPLVALRGAARWVRDREPIRLDEPAGLPARLRQGGVYLVTGGFGGIGMVLAQRLAELTEARLVLLSRTPTPEPEGWGKWLAEHGEADPVSQRIRALQTLAALGSEVLVLAVDVADREQMRGALERARARFGPLHGVIHAAGVPGGGIIQQKTSATAAVLAPKVAGTLVLDELLGDEPLDFMVLCSSTIALDGGPGQADYCAANAFLDAFAQARNRRGHFTVSINWGQWTEVGMAVASRRGGAARRNDQWTGDAPPLHPLIERRVEDRAGRHVYSTLLDPQRQWFLAEHRVAGKPVLPGTAYLEMARAAFAAQEPASAVELRNVFFLAPLHLAEGDSREARVSLRAETEGLAFSIRAADTEHAVGQIRALDEAPPRPRSLDELSQRCQATVLETDTAIEEPGLVTWGPRWRSFKRAGLGAGEGIAFLVLPDEFAGETAVFALHPALLDRATACCTLLLDGGVHLPLSYGRLRLWRPLPPRLYSYFVQRESGAAEGGVSSFDITLLDESGAVIAAIQEFTLRQVESLLAADPRAGRVLAASAGPAPVGLGSAEGAEAFLRVLDRINFPQVVVSREAPAAPSVSPDGPAAGLEQAQTLIAAVPRRAGQARYVAPRNEVERTIAGLWGELLGIADIGVFDDFFELGGHSVLALQMISRLRDTFGIDLPLNVLFEAPTAAELAEVVLRRLSEAAEGLDLDAALADLEQLSDDEVRALIADPQQTSE